jgi:hypothetical protein
VDTKFLHSTVGFDTAAEEHRRLLNQRYIYHHSHPFQHPLLIAFDQFIEQPQHGLNHPRMWRNLPRGAEGFDGLKVTVTFV